MGAIASTTLENLMPAAPSSATYRKSYPLVQHFGVINTQGYRLGALNYSGEGAGWGGNLAPTALQGGTSGT